MEKLCFTSNPFRLQLKNDETLTELHIGRKDVLVHVRLRSKVFEWINGKNLKFKYKPIGIL